MDHRVRRETVSSSDLKRCLLLLAGSSPETFSRSVVSTSRLLSGEQSNSNIAYGNESIVKVFRRVQPGLNPDIELGRYLTEEAGNQYVAPLLADWTLVTGQGASSSIGLARRACCQCRRRLDVAARPDAGRA